MVFLYKYNHSLISLAISNYCVLITQQVDCIDIYFRTILDYTCIQIYHMAGNFRGVLIFMIFVVDLIGCHEIFPPTKVDAYGDMVM